jgi:hypothetical protein
MDDDVTPGGMHSRSDTGSSRPAQGLPDRRFVVLGKRPGREPEVVTRLLSEDRARDALALMFDSTRVRSVQYALAELTLVETYR